MSEGKEKKNPPPGGEEEKKLISEIFDDSRGMTDPKGPGEKMADDWIKTFLERVGSKKS